MTPSSACLNRRRFLNQTLQGAAAAGLAWMEVPRLLADSREASAMKYGGFPMGIQSYSLRGFGVDGALDKIHELELHHVEFFRMHFPPTPDVTKIEAMQAKLAQRDISISAHGVESFSKDHKANEAFFRFAKQAGIRNISANPQPDSFESLNRLVAQYDIRIAIHNHGPGALYDSPLDGLKAVAGFDKRIGFCADLGHYIRSGVDPVEVIYQLGDRLYGIHLKDFAEQKKDTQGVILGRGHLDLEGVFKALKRIGFPADGALSLEYEEHPDNPMEDIRACLQVAAESAQRVARG